MAKNAKRLPLPGHFLEVSMSLRKIVFTQCCSGLSGFGDGVCHQEFRKMCDMNEILRTFRATGVLPNVAGLVSMPCDQFLFADFAEDVANPINLEVNRDVDKVDDGDSCASEGRDKTSSVVEKDEVNKDGVKGEPSANPVADA